MTNKTQITSAPVLSDICWTLFYENTTLAFANQCVWDMVSSWQYDFLRSRLGSLCHSALYRMTGKDKAREYLIGQMKGTKLETLEQAALSLVDSMYETQRITQTWDLLREREVWLVSSTVDVIAEAVAKRFGFRVLASNRLQYDDNGVCLGTAEPFNPAQKLTEKDLDALCVFDCVTDNMTDMPLILRARHAYIHTYHNEKRWQRLLQNAQCKTNITFIPHNRRRY